MIETTKKRVRERKLREPIFKLFWPQTERIRRSVRVEVSSVRLGKLKDLQ